MNKETKKPSAVVQMWDATTGFIRSLDAHPGWKDFQVARMVRALDLDDLLPADGSTLDEFELPAELDLQHNVVIQYLGLLESVLSVKSCEYYFRRYPFRGLPVSHHEHLINICEMFFSRFYEFREKLKKYTVAIAKASPQHGLNFGQFIKAFDSDFKTELVERNQINHHQRFSDFAIQQVYIAGVMVEKRSRAAQREHLALYRKVANEWALRARTRGTRLDAYTEAVASATLMSCDFLSKHVTAYDSGV